MLSFFRNLVICNIRSALLLLCLLGCKQGFSYDVSDAVYSFYQYNPQFKSMKQQVDAVKLNQNLAVANFLPQAYGQSSYNSGELRNANPTSPGYNVVSLVVQQSIFNGGKDWASLTGAIEQYKGAENKLASQEESMLATLVSLYQRVLSAREIFEYTEESTENFRRYLKITEAKFDVKQVTITQLDEAKAALSNAISKLARAEGVLNAVSASFAYVVGEEPPVTDMKGIELKNIIVPESLDEFKSEVLEKNPNIMAAAHELKSSTSAVYKAVGQVAPTASISATTNRSDISNKAFVNSPSVDGTTFTLNVSVPIFVGGANVASIKQAKATQRQYKYSFENVKQEMLEKSIQSWSQFFASYAALSAQQDALKFYERALDSAFEQYKIGFASLKDLIDMQNNLYDAQINFAELKAQVVADKVALMALSAKLKGFDFSSLSVK